MTQSLTPEDASRSSMNASPYTSKKNGGQQGGDVPARGRFPKRAAVRLLPGLLSLLILASCSHLTEGGAPGMAPTDDPSLLLKIYQGPLNHLAAVRGGTCPIHPSCSEYSRQAIIKHGARMGWIMTIDRLMRCGRDEMDLARRVIVDGKWKIYDPVKHNDFWWYENNAGDSHPASRIPKGSR